MRALAILCTSFRWIVSGKSSRLVTPIASAPRTAAAVRFIHANRAHPWTIEKLARKVGLSRSRFAERFAAQLGVSPMQYLARWRMQLAVRILDERQASIAQVAAKVGYQSEVAVQRAFKKCVGTPRISGGTRAGATGTGWRVAVSWGKTEKKPPSKSSSHRPTLRMDVRFGSEADPRHCGWALVRTSS